MALTQRAAPESAVLETCVTSEGATWEVQNRGLGNRQLALLSGASTIAADPAVSVGKTSNQLVDGATILLGTALSSVIHPFRPR